MSSAGGKKEGQGSDTDKDIENRSAVKIQAGVRGYLVRKKKKAERDAAVKIQAGFRGYKTRRQVKLNKNDTSNN